MYVNIVLREATWFHFAQEQDPHLPLFQAILPYDSEQALPRSRVELCLMRIELEVLTHCEDLERGLPLRVRFPDLSFYQVRGEERAMPRRRFMSCLSDLMGSAYIVVTTPGRQKRLMASHHLLCLAKWETNIHLRHVVQRQSAKRARREPPRLP